MPFIQITDLHFVPGNGVLHSSSPKERLSSGIQHINRLKHHATFILATGDLAHHGEVAAYKTLKETLDPLDLPIHMMMGNHDSRAPFRQVFANMPEIDGGFVQFRLDVDTLRILCLDSLHDEPGEHQGVLCPTRLKWLQDELAAAPADKKIVMAVHHPPFNLGLPNMDDIRLKDDEALCEVFQTRKPDMMLHGHVHRPISGTWRGIPFHIQRGFNHQVALDFDRQETLRYCEADPDIAVIRDEGESIIVHTQSVGGEGDPFTSGIATAYVK